MPNYTLSHISQHYTHAANPPHLDKIVFTIDHIHQGGAGRYSTADVVKFLTDRNIPVTVFLQCTDPANFCLVDSRNASDVYHINPGLVSLGAHSLPKGESQSTQANNLTLISDMITNITGAAPVILSYHGNQAGPESNINYAGVNYARGITSNWSAAQQGDPLNTPVMSLGSVNAAFDYTRLRNISELSATLFVHSAELINGSPKKAAFDTFIQAVIDRKLQALSYLAAMQSDYSSNPDNPSISPCPLDNFTNNTIRQYLRINIRDGVNGVYQVAELQRFLNKLGLDAGTADGIFGSNTKLAVIAYQVINGLGTDGIVGTNTRASINAYCD